MVNYSINIIKSSELTLNRISYVIDELNNHPITLAYEIKFNINGTSENIIDYGIINKKDSYTIPRQGIIFEDVSCDLFINQYQFQDEEVQSVESEDKERQQFISEQSFAFDIFETIFFHLSRYEERTLKQSEYLGKKLEFENQLLLIKHRYEKIPVVDTLIQAFLKKISGKDIVVEKPKALSHDIDYIQKFNSPLSIFRKIAGHIRHRKPINGFPYLWKTYMDYLLKGQDSFDNFEWLLSEKYIKKTIYFLVGGIHKNDNKYNLKNKIVQKAIRLAKERNYSFGIHPSYESWNRMDLMIQEKEKLEKELDIELVNSRQHYLNFDIEKTPKLLQLIGIKEDSSLGYTRYIGYRCGTGFPYNLYDFENEKAFGISEVPLVFMDSSWWHEYQRENKVNILESLNNLYGMMNFHNSFFDELNYVNKNIKDNYQDFF